MCIFKPHLLYTHLPQKSTLNLKKSCFSVELYFLKVFLEGIVFYFFQKVTQRLHENPSVYSPVIEKRLIYWLFEDVEKSLSADFL